MLLVGLADRQRVDREATLPEQRDHTVQDGRPVLHGGNQCVLHREPPCAWTGVGPAPTGTATGTGVWMAGRTYGRSGITSESAAPDGTIGKTFSSRDTQNSIRAGPGCARAAAITDVRSSGLVTRQAGMPYASASFT